MTRLSAASYRRRIWLLSAIYVASFFFVWPYAKTAPGLPVRTLLAVLPALPIIAMMAVMAQRMLHSDELEQRVHMGALGVATAIVCVVSVVGGFLAAAHVVAFDGDILIWVFPVVCLSYGAARLLLARRYGGGSCE